MGIEIEIDWSAVPDGQTVPHAAEAAEIKATWNAGRRRAWLVQHLGQIAYLACCVLVPLLIVMGAAKH